MSLYTLAQLQDAARRSMQLAPDPQTGKRAGDPLPVMVTDSNAYKLAPLVKVITGREAYAPNAAQLAALLRSQLRRWAGREANA